VLLAAFIVLKNSIQLFHVNKWFIDQRSFKAALPFGIVVLLMSAHYRLDGFLLERIHSDGAHQAGIYAGAYRLLDAANMIGFLYASFLLPFIARRSGQGESIESIVLNGRHLLVISSVTIAIATVFLAPWIQKVLYHNQDANAIDILQWCLPALIGYSLVQVYGTVLTATGRLVPFCYIVFASLILNILLNFILIPAYGAKGCCIAAVSSQLVCGLATLLYASKKCAILIEPSSLLKYIFIAGIAVATFYLCRQSGMASWLQLIIAGVVVITAALFTRLIDLSRWSNFIKQTDTK
jgi:O-antigen/teichoic acid export membrane protein